MRNLSTNCTFRFNALKRLLPDISSTVLFERLLELEREGLITKKIYPEIPIRIDCSLTTRVKELETILYQSSNWVNRKYYEKK